MTRRPHSAARPRAWVGLALAPALAASCATYNERTNHALRAFERGRFEEALVAYGEDGVTGSAFLGGAEAGTVALVAGRWGAALEHLGRAAQAVRKVEERALVSPESAGETVLSWALNDTLTEYRGEGYERVMLHACLGLAYLAVGGVEDALVEARLANALLETEEELYGSRYGAGGLAHFLSAVGYELVGDLDDAYIDYKRMETKGIGGVLVGRSLVRLATALGRADELGAWESRWGPDLPRPEQAARLIVVAGVGLGPYKEEGKLTVPTGDGLLSWAVPAFRRRPQPVPHVVLELPTLDTRVQTVVVEDVGRVAKENLDDRLAWLAAKSTVRTFLKRELAQELEAEHGAAGFLLGNLFTVLSERADLRTWTTLPDTWQAARLFVEPGFHELALSAPGCGRIELGSYGLEPGETMFVLARTLGQTLHAYPIGGRPVLAPSAAPAAPPDQENR